MSNKNETIKAKIKSFIADLVTDEEVVGIADEEEKVELADEEEKVEETESTETTEEKVEETEEVIDEAKAVDIKEALEAILGKEIDLTQEGYFSISVNIYDGVAEASVHESSYKELQLSEEAKSEEVVKLSAEVKAKADEVLKLKEDFKAKLSELENMTGENNIIQAPVEDVKPIKLTKHELLKKQILGN